MAGLIAIVGRPNVGKSALFNRIVGRRISIVHDQPGVTRDRLSAEAEWRGRPFTLVDTGGLGLLRGEKVKEVIIQAAVEQAKLAIDAADVIIFVVNVQEGAVPLDLEVAERLRRSGKPVLVAVNKVDTEKAHPHVVEFAELGFERIFPVSAIHDEGIELLMDAAVGLLPVPSHRSRVPSSNFSPDAERGTRDSQPLRLAVLGRPNVGKSSIINALTESERVIVSPVPGTTRDSIDVPFEIETGGIREQYVLIDTAGMRKARRVHEPVEFFSVQRAEDSIERCDIAILVLDAQDGILEQDMKIAAKIVEAHKACILVVNKWDLYEETIRSAREQEIARRNRISKHDEPERMTTLSEFGAWVQEKLFFLSYAPVIFTSAKSGFNLDRLLEVVRYVAAQLQQMIPTAILNRAIRDAVQYRQPVSSTGQRLKFFYATQIKESPPTFLVFVNRDELLSAQYKKYLADELRRAFGYEGCPILLVPKPRPKTIEPVRAERRSGQKKAFARHAPPPRFRAAVKVRKR